MMPTRRALAARSNSSAALGRERPVVLGDLVALREVGIEVVLAREDRALVDRAPERQRGLHRQLDRAAVEDRQRAGQAEADRADVVLGGAPKRVLQPQNSLVA